MSEKWNYHSPTPEQLLRQQQFATDFRLHPAVCLLLAQRGFSTKEEVQQFLYPGLRDLHDPFGYADMAIAVERLENALGNKEKILIYGDYDVDGTTATALVYKFLVQFAVASQLDYYIPDRSDEEPGISKQGIDYAQAKGATLIIAVDCGIKSNDAIAYAQTLGIDVIICDHHTPDDELPPALAILNAKLEQSTYPYPHLSGCGVAFKLMHAFAQNNGMELSHVRHLLDLCAVSIASDIVPLTGENRVMTVLGLRQLSQNPSKGLRGIIDVCGLTGRRVTIGDIIFKIGPRINASGRMMNGRETVDLLLSKDAQTAKEKSANIDQYNDDRRELDKKTTEEAYTMLEAHPERFADKIVVLFEPSWHKGVIGIVASRLAEKLYKPTIILTESNGMICGSARSVTGFDLYAAVESTADILVNFGGHTSAVGITIEEKNLEAFKKNLEAYAEKNMIQEQMTQTLDIDLVLQLNEITDKLLTDLNAMQPHGEGNQKPVFCSLAVHDAGNSKLVGKDCDHIKLDLADDSSPTPVPAIAFGMCEKYSIVKSGQPFDVCYTVEENNYGGATSLQLLVKDIRVH
ncbi:single-stranded-DNA-specific exonuclease RecJ [Bacteroidia bacterium]|nr:single-stranded-DNA-specific exonuclease RecJ [Bacteroidia bacterium]GHT42724.1 single-stranded-DNA-specific exonuclease RecJ [Bacteroidia bacterium]